MTDMPQGGKCAVLQENLSPALTALKKSIEANPKLPILGYALLTTGDSQLRLTCTDLEVAQTFTIGAKIDMDFSVAIHLDTAQALVALLDKGRIDIEYVFAQGTRVADNALDIIMRQRYYNTTTFKGIHASEFPLVSTQPATDMLGTLRDFQAAQKAVAEITKIAGDGDIQIMADRDSVRFTAHSESRVQMSFATLETMGDGPTEPLTTYASAKALNRVFKTVLGTSYTAISAIGKRTKRSEPVALGLYRNEDYTAFVITHQYQDVRIQCHESKVTYPTYTPIAKWYLPSGKLLAKDSAESLVFHFDQAQFASESISVPALPGDSLGNDADNHVIDETAYARLFHHQLVFEGASLKALHKTMTSFGKKPIELMLAIGNVLILSDGICQHIILASPAKRLTSLLQGGSAENYGEGVVFLEDGAIMGDYGYEVASGMVIAYQVHEGKRIYSFKAFESPKNFARHVYSKNAPLVYFNRHTDKAAVQRFIDHFKPQSTGDKIRAMAASMQPSQFTRCGESMPSRKILSHATLLGYWPEGLLAQCDGKLYMIATRLHEAYEVSIQEETL